MSERTLHVPKGRVVVMTGGGGGGGSSFDSRPVVVSGPKYASGGSGGSAMTDQGLQSLRNMGNECEAAADEIAALRADLAAAKADAERYKTILREQKPAAWISKWTTAKGVEMTRIGHSRKDARDPDGPEPIPLYPRIDAALAGEGK